MSTTQAYKICPGCKLLADVNASACGVCGRRYHTQFLASPEAAAAKRRITRATRLLYAGIGVTLLAFCTTAGALVSENQNAVAAWVQPAPPLEPLVVPPTLEVQPKPNSVPAKTVTPPPTTLTQPPSPAKQDAKAGSPAAKPDASRPASAPAPVAAVRLQSASQGHIPGL